jgi:hypothetical protein
MADKTKELNDAKKDAEDKARPASGDEAGAPRTDVDHDPETPAAKADEVEKVSAEAPEPEPYQPAASYPAGVPLPQHVLDQQPKADAPKAEK